LEVVLPEPRLKEVEDLLRDEPMLEVWYERIWEQRILLKILATVEENEHLMDLLGRHFAGESQKLFVAVTGLLNFL